MNTYLLSETINVCIGVRSDYQNGGIHSVSDPLSENSLSESWPWGRQTQIPKKSSGIQSCFGNTVRVKTITETLVILKKYSLQITVTVTVS